MPMALSYFIFKKSDMVAITSGASQKSSLVVCDLEPMDFLKG